MKNTMCDILAYQGRVAGSLILFWLRLHVNLFGCMFCLFFGTVLCFWVTGQLIFRLVFTHRVRAVDGRERPGPCGGFQPGGVVPGACCPSSSHS